MHPPSQENEWRLLPRLSEAVSVGAVGPSSARLWLRSESVKRVTLRLSGENGTPTHEVTRDLEPSALSDFTSAFTYPADFPGAAALEPRTRYSYRLECAHSGRLIGTGGFETFPQSRTDAPDRFCFALASCHQPFGTDGKLRTDATAMMQGTLALFAEHAPRFVLWSGDQLYADVPSIHSLLEPSHFRLVAPEGRGALPDCSPEEVRRLYQDRYRVFWSMPEHQRLMAGRPSFPILDDHEVLNNWGSDPAHAHPRWQNVQEGALAAYYDYQASRVLPRNPAPGGDFHLAFDYGHIGIFVLDVRSQRRVDTATGTSTSDAQWDALSAWLESHREHDAVFLVISNPLLFLPPWLTRLIALSSHREESWDRWSHFRFRPDRARLLALLQAHQSRSPRQHVVLLSGDVHVGYALHLTWNALASRGVHQFVSSPFTNGLTGLPARTVAQLSPWLLRTTHLSGESKARVRTLPGAVGLHAHPYPGLNVGLVEVTKMSEGASVRFRLFGAPDAEGRLRAVYDSGAR